jgi:hypothetical protein
MLAAAAAAAAAVCSLYCQTQAADASCHQQQLRICRQLILYAS